MNRGPVILIAPERRYLVTACRLGVPLPRGWMGPGAVVDAISSNDGSRVPVQVRPLARWADGSVKWLLVDTVKADGTESNGFELRVAGGEASPPGGMRCEVTEQQLMVDTGSITVAFDKSGSRLVRSIRTRQDGESLGEAGIRLKAMLQGDREAVVRLLHTDLEESGPLRTIVRQRGTIDCTHSLPLEFVARWSVLAGSAGIQLELNVRNPNPAQHAAGVWDLGDPGSVLIADLSLEATPADTAENVAWRATPSGPVVTNQPVDWSLYQDSSGGDQWRSPNHVEADGSIGVSFRGWRSRGANGELSGDRAQPSIEIQGRFGRIAASLQNFWQNFPKALRWRDGRLSIGLFPAERRTATELQGGEQKRHRIAFAFGGGALDVVRDLVDPPHVWVDPSWVAQTDAIPGGAADLADFPAWRDYVSVIVDETEGFAARRERIDEYGWRNFGDLWADHEAVGSQLSEPFVSHYNNQYDFVHSAGVHAMRTGDPRWARLASEAADHTVDIDIYHTDRDRVVFNGGLFWHTDHYRPAGTATHRTYSRQNADGQDYGGGPSNEHDYSSGLLLHYFRTGDPAAREAVIGLADWVCRNG